MENVKRLLFMCLTLIITFCGSAKVFAAGSSTISILGFVNRVQITNLSGEQVANFSIINDYLADEFINSGKLEVYDISPEVTKGRMDEVALQLDLAAGQASILKNVPAEYVVYGYVTNMSVVESTTGIDDMDGSAIGGDSTAVRVNLSAKIVETATGKILLTVTGKGESAGSKVMASNKGKVLQFGKSNVTEECLHNALAKATHDIAVKILEAA